MPDEKDPWRLRFENSALDPASKGAPGDDPRAQIAALNAQLPKAAAAEAVRLHLTIAEIERGPLLDLNAASRSYRSALALDPSNARALSGLLSLSEQVMDWAEALVILERMAELAEDPEERLRCLLRLVGIARERLGDTQKADEYLAQARDLDPTASG